MNDRASQLVVDIAKRFIEYALAAVGDNGWDEAFLRYEGWPQRYGVTSIYRKGEKSAFLDSELSHETDIALGKQFRELSQELAKATGKEFVVALLRVDAEHDYKMFYEYQDPKKWYITKMNGQSGIPKID